MVAVPLVLIAVVALCVMAFKAGGGKSHGPADDLKAQIEALKKQVGQNPGSTENGATEDSPDVKAAKSEMDRLRKQYDISPPTDSKGDVHLQVGGTVTQEQYQKALDSLNRSKLVR